MAHAALSSRKWLSRFWKQPPEISISRLMASSSKPYLKIGDVAGAAIGLHLRQLRIKRGLPLAQVAKNVGISVGFLSALERSHMSASVGTLRKLARFYKTNILDFFDPTESNSRVVRPNHRK